VTQLQYHQKTYDLLTQNPFDVQAYVKMIENEHETDVQAHVRATDDEKNQMRERHAQWRNRHLQWAKLDLYQRPVQFSDKNIQELNKWEAHHNFKLPASVREWYSLDIAPQIMGTKAIEYMDIPDLYPDERNTCYFLYWEYVDQGGDSLAFRLDAGDDPPVVAWYSNDLPMIEPMFSQFIYCHFFDWYANYQFPYYFSVFYHPILSFGGMAEATQYHMPIQHFRIHFDELTTHYEMRFYDEHYRMYLRPLAITNDSGEITATTDKIAGGNFLADSLEHLKTLPTLVWGDNPPYFHMEQYTHDDVDKWITSMCVQVIKDGFDKYHDWFNVEDIVSTLKLPRNIMANVARRLQAGIEINLVAPHPDNVEYAHSNKYKLI